MDSADLEDLSLWLMAPDNDCPEWLEIWAAAYPTACLQRLGGSADTWARQTAETFAAMPSENIAVVAYGAATAAFAAWLYRADILSRKTVKNIIWVTPPPELSDGLYGQDALRASCPCRAALVIGTGNSEAYQRKMADLAQRWRAKRLIAPDFGRLNAVSGGWEWGMKLMQEMLLD